ncbi:MAG TPA: NUDIX domain-containing protein [Xanthomonadaceae bacterium]|nr:NUDIX domain-containing protein [Xanthomonadaceae bacterium]
MNDLARANPLTSEPVRAVLSPCIGTCRLDPAGYCEGCHRTGSEIAAWLSIDDAMRLRYMDEILPARAALQATSRDEEVARFRRALLGLQSPPTGQAWNRAELSDLIPDGMVFSPAAVLVGLIPRDSGWQVMLTLRTADLRHHAGQVSFPGGRIEAGDADPVAAALRETCEEIGIPSAQVEPLGYLDPFDTISGFHVYPVVARIAPDYRPIRDPREVADVFEVPLDYLLDASNIRLVAREFAGKLRHYHEYSYARHRIWGATAAMLVNLRERLEKVR